MVELVLEIVVAMSVAASTFVVESVPSTRAINKILFIISPYFTAFIKILIKLYNKIKFSAIYYKSCNL